jgi:hypothetical protein
MKLKSQAEYKIILLKFHYLYHLLQIKLHEIQKEAEKPGVITHLDMSDHRMEAPGFKLYVFCQLFVTQLCIKKL